MGIVIKTPREIGIMRQAGNIVAKVLRKLSEQVMPGMETRKLDLVAVAELEKMGAESAFKGYRGYPASLCVSINDEVVHGIPQKRVIHQGDIVSLDFGAIFNGFHGDAAITVNVGNTDPAAKQLITITKGALEAGIAVALPGNKLGDISSAIQSYVESRGYSVVREYTGHGIGREMHEEPQIPNVGIAGTGLTLKEGMTLALEPMVNVGDWRTRVGSDHWTVYTFDGSLSAHFEHTIVISENGAEILTKEDNCA